MSLKESWTVYIVETESGKLYTGITTDLDRRFKEHLEKKRGAKFFSISAPKQILFQENHSNRSEASIREAEIKRMSRPQKLALINTSGLPK
jgi:putative endonuclease